MAYSDVASLIDQYETISEEHAKIIADALARKGYLVHLEFPPEWGKGYEVVPQDYASPGSGTFVRATL